MIEMKTEKQLNALIYAIEKYPTIGRTKLMKFVFFVDLFRYNQTGDTLLEDEYIRLPNGPVPDIGYSYTDNPNAYLDVKCRQIDPERCQYQYTPRKKCETSVFSGDDLKLFDIILDALKNHNTASVSELTHRFRLWKEAVNSEIITKDRLRLDDYEYDELESFFYYVQATKSAGEIAEYSEPDFEDPIPEEILNLQFKAINGAE